MKMYFGVEDEVGKNITHIHFSDQLTMKFIERERRVRRERPDTLLMLMRVKGEQVIVVASCRG